MNTPTERSAIIGLRRDLSFIVRAALEAVIPHRLMQRAVDDHLHIPPSTSFNLIAAGKAAETMAEAFLEHYGNRLGAGIVVRPVSASERMATWPAIELIAAGHPIPNEGSQQAGLRALQLAAGTAPGSCLIVLLSGGASALLTAPADTLSLDHKRRVTELLLRAGADIDSLNTVRKHLSKLKGGRLAAACRSPVITLAISDVVGHDPSVIASGPTVADPTSFEDARDALSRFGLRGQIPEPVLTYLQAGVRGDVADTPKPGDVRLSRSSFVVIGSGRDATDAATHAAASLGYAGTVCPQAVTGEARVAARSLLTTAIKLLQGVPRPACVISAGETTVRVIGRGRGGRNQELALACAPVVSALGPAALVASVGTDGIDGPTDAAGALVDSTTLERAREAGLGAPADYLEHNDSYSFFSALGDLIITGPTGTNVGDLQIIMVA